MFGSLSFVVFCRSSFLRVVVRKIFRERTFVFGCRCRSCVFWCCFAYVFALLFGFPLPKMLRKNSLDVRSCVSGFFFSPLLVFSPMSSPFFFFFSFSFFRETDQVVTGHTPTRTWCFFLFLSVSPPHSGCSPVLAVRPFFLAFCRGAILGPGRFLDSLGRFL